MELRGRTFFRGKLEDCRILVEGGRIMKVEKNTAERNVRGVILPAGVDMHVHFRDPGYVHKEDFYSGSVAAAFGGISCVFDMPNTKPRVKDRITLEEKREVAREKALLTSLSTRRLRKDVTRSWTLKPTSSTPMRTGPQKP